MFNDQPRPDYGIEVMYRVIWNLQSSVYWRFWFDSVRPGLIMTVMLYHGSLQDLILLKDPPILAPSLI